MDVLKHIVTLALNRGCGVTVDVYSGSRGSATEPRVQWLWAVPLHDLADEQVDDEAALAGLARLVDELGFRPQEEQSPPSSGLLNGFSHEDSCPFDPDGCPGAHLVVSGRGHVDDHRLRQALSARDAERGRLLR